MSKRTGGREERKQAARERGRFRGKRGSRESPGSGGRGAAHQHLPREPGTVPPPTPPAAGP